LFSRSRNCLPVLKKGTAFSVTATCSPVRGLRPWRASRRLTEESAEAAQFHPVAARERRGDLIEDGGDDALDIPLIEMRIGFRQAGNQLGLGHGAL
jgi:hypothetical protein